MDGNRISLLLSIYRLGRIMSTRVASGVADEVIFLFLGPWRFSCPTLLV